jgi:hypothetical protein
MTETSWGQSFTEDEFSVGRILSRSFAILSQNFLQFVGLAAIATSPCLVFGAGTDYSLDAEPAQVTGFLVTLFAYLITQAVILHGAFQDMRGLPVGIGDSLRVGLARFLPLLGLLICMVIVTVAGFLLLIVPGLIALSIFFASVPACVVERLGPFRSMRRSASLTKGYRRRIFGLLLLLGTGSGIVSTVLTLALATLGFGASSAGLWISEALFAAYSAVVGVVVYHDLRVAKEGVEIK